MTADVAESSSSAPDSTDIHRVFESLVARVKDERLRNILQMAFAALDISAIDKLQRELDDLAADSSLKRDMTLQSIPRQLAIYAPYAAALDLDRLAPARILGIGRVHGPLLYYAKAFRHDVLAFYPGLPAYDRLMQFFGIAHHQQTKGGEFPEGQYEIIIAGNQAHGTVANWNDFFLPLSKKLSASGRVFLTLVKPPIPDKQYNPNDALSMFERAGATVSRKAFFVIIDIDQMRKLTPAPADTASRNEAEPTSGVPASIRLSDKAKIGIAISIALIVAAAVYWFTR